MRKVKVVAECKISSHERAESAFVDLITTLKTILHINVIF